MARYKLPDALGGGEVTLREKDQRYGPDRYVRVQVGEGDEAFTVDLLRGLLIQVDLPEEPPIGAVVMVDGEACQHFDLGDDNDSAKCWASVGSTERWSWVQLCDLALPGEPMRLVPAAASEPVVLPWVYGPVGVSLKPNGLGGSPHKVAVDVRGNQAQVVAGAARDMARALTTAADAAEKEGS